MLTDLLASDQSPWTKGTGPENDVVLCSRIRLARNFAAFAFPWKLEREKAYQVWKIVADVAEMRKDMRFYDLSRLDALTRKVLVEKHLISPQQADTENQFRALVLQDQMTDAIMINEEDHVRIQSFTPGFDLQQLWQKASALDDAIGASGHYAYDDEWGYLTTCPTNIGTGLRASVMVHLPALEKTGRIQMLQQLPAMGMAVRGLFGEGSKAYGHFYQISNQKTLGFSEEDIIANLIAVTERIIGEERAARQRLTEDQLAYEDKVYRSLGILSQARLMTTTDAFEHLSVVRVGIAQNAIKRLHFADIDPLFVAVQSGALQLSAQHDLTELERDRARATVLRDTINLILRSEEDVK